MVVLEADQRYYSVTEVAKLLGLSRCRVHQLIEHRGLQTKRVANAIVIPECEVHRLQREERRPGRPKSL